MVKWNQNKYIYAYNQKLKYQIALIRAWFAVCDPLKPSHQKALEKACLVIYDFQTNSEKLSHETKELNDLGFNGKDADFGTAMAQRILQMRAGQSQYSTLSPKMYAALHRMLKKYARQLAVAFLNKEAFQSTL